MIQNNFEKENMPLNDVQIPFEGWPNLPYVALEKVFSHLPMKDRFSASLVCHDWNHVFQSSSLWVKMDFYIEEDDMIDEKIFKFIDKFGSKLESLKVHQSYYTGTNDDRFPETENLVKFFNLLQSKGPKLKELILEDFDCYYADFNQVPDLTECLSEFLKSQKFLKYLKIHDVSTVDDGIKILNAALLHGKNSIEILDVDDVFYKGYSEKEVATSETFVNTIAGFKRLRIFKIHGPEMEWLEELAPRISKNFELLKIKTAGGEPLMLADWNGIVGAYRRIQVKYFINVDSWYLFAEDISLLSIELPDIMPLTDLKMCFLDLKDLAVYSKVFEYIGDTFQDTIESLCLSFGIRDETIATHMITLIKKLKKLKKIHVASGFHPTLMNFVSRKFKEEGWVIVNKKEAFSVLRGFQN